MVEGSAQHPHRENPTWLTSLATGIGFHVSRGVGTRRSSGVLGSANSYLSLMALQASFRWVPSICFAFQLVSDAYVITTVECEGNGPYM